MAYDENIRIIAEELERVKNRPTGDKLPEVDSSDEGKVLAVNSSGEWDPANVGSGGYNITSTEVKTNKQYNGNDVYVKVFSTAFSGSGGWANLIEMPDYIDTIISANILSHANQNPVIVNSIMMVDNGNLRVYNPGAFTGSDSVLILEYTKKTTNRKKGAK